MCAVVCLLGIIFGLIYIVDRHSLQALYGWVFASATHLACEDVFVSMGSIDVLLKWAMRKFDSFWVSQFYELLHYISLRTRISVNSCLIYMTL